MHPEELLTLRQSIYVLDRFASASHLEAAASSIPASLYQYWDRCPSEQVQALLDRNRELCQSNGIAWHLLTDDSAREFLHQCCPENVYAAYDMAPHPAMKSDVLRVALLAARGGFYLDADMVLREHFVGLFALPGDLAVFRWKNGRRNICSWLLGATPGSPPITFLRDAMAHSVSSACTCDPDAALLNSLAVAGPGVMTRGVATFINDREGMGQLEHTGITVRSVEYAYTCVQNGPGFLGSPLDYKQTDRHWLVAAQGGLTQ